MKPWTRILLITLMAIPGLSRGENSRSLRVREFAVMGYQGILNDISAGKGPYVNSLLNLLAVPADQVPQTIDQIKSLAQRYPNIMDFADRVAADVAPKTAPALPTDRKLISGSELENALQHLGRGMQVTAYLQNGDTLKGRVIEYDSGRLLIRTVDRKSKVCRIADIRALEAPNL
jgi:hypothetical protein